MPQVSLNVVKIQYNQIARPMCDRFGDSLVTMPMSPINNIDHLAFEVNARTNDASRQSSDDAT